MLSKLFAALRAWAESLRLADLVLIRARLRPGDVPGPGPIVQGAPPYALLTGGCHAAG
ncbi:hypothetical protein [Burkholderia anthina]|uniref:hypothetical protein n=1 Tax=Burkholderia anthina TaxID=179879 RepID=UPI001AA093EA|nr:hypothetical protein [Burkholderia anthina]QTD88770.1 hypothetical protein J4G50_13165 [Burkholderia anthina]